jgi:hypothetical protein
MTKKEIVNLVLQSLYQSVREGAGHQADGSMADDTYCLCCGKLSDTRQTWSIFRKSEPKQSTLLNSSVPPPFAPSREHLHRTQNKEILRALRNVVFVYGC